MNAQTEIFADGAASLGPTILHPTDFGPTSASALVHAVGLALKTHGRLTLLHIRGVDEAGPTRNGLAPVSDLLVRWGLLGEEERFADTQTRLGFSAACADVPARSVSAGVIEHLEDHYFDLAVLSTHARTGLAYWFAGSTSRRALRRARAMTLFLREGQRGFVDPDSGELKLRRVLMPVDGKIPVADAVNKVKRLRERLGAGFEMRLLHVGASAPPGYPRDIPLILAQGPVAAAILKTAEDFRADAIIVPTTGKRGMLAAMRSSISAQILEDARWPVLSMPA
jgi:nucleotide-binding universal stress UspA family protein